MTVRLRRPTAEFIDSRVDGTGPIRNRSEYLQHWAEMGMQLTEHPEVYEAVEWALAEAEKEDHPMVLVPPHVAVNTTEEQEAAATITIPLDPTPQVFTQPGDELEEIRESQLEALRNRVR